MIIQDLHQPYIYKEGLTARILVSQIQEEKLNFIYGIDNTNVSEDYWKLKILDLDGTITNIVTPTTLTVNNVLYNVIAECNGYLYNNKLSYIVGLHTTQNYTPIYLFLVKGDFDPITNTVSNVQIIEGGRTGYVKGSDVYSIDLINKTLKVNNIDVFDFSGYINSLTRIIGVESENKTIITGYDSISQTLVSYLYSHDDQSFYKLLNNNNDDVYKSSYYGDTNTGIFAYAERINLGNNVFNYLLNVETGYVLQPTI